MLWLKLNNKQAERVGYGQQRKDDGQQVRRLGSDSRVGSCCDYGIVCLPHKWLEKAA
jgi:hypothetical protein